MLLEIATISLFKYSLL